ncbi:hypothetical protein DRH14_05610, partial [Candidatus Shapirobacteria bacterium]
MRRKIVAIFIILLVLTTPLAFAQSSSEEYDEEETGESVVVIVKSYEPEVLPSSVIEDDDVNVYAYLQGTTLGSFLGVGETAEPLYSQPEIRNVIVTPLDSESQKYLLRSPRAIKPKTGYSLDNLATVLFTIKRIEKEEDIPDRIDLNMQAEVWFTNAERFPYFLQQDIVVPEDRDEQKWRENLHMEGHQYSFFSGMGFLRAERIGPSRVEFTVYGGDDLIWPYTGTPRPIRSFSLSKGEITTDVKLSEAGLLKENRFRIRLNDIVDSSVPKAEIEVTQRGITERRIVTEGMRIYPGSTFVVEKIYEPKKVGENKTEYSILIRGKEYLRRGEDEYNLATYLVKKYSLGSVVGEEGVSKTVLEEKGDICDKVNLLFSEKDLRKGSPEEVACTAIFELKQVLQEAGNEADDSGVLLRDRANFLIGKIYKEQLGDSSRALEYLERSISGNRGEFIPEAKKLISDLKRDIQEGAVYKPVDLQEGNDAVHVKLLRIIRPSPDEESYAVIETEQTPQSEPKKGIDEIMSELEITPDNIYSRGNAKFKEEWLSAGTALVREGGQLYTMDESAGQKVKLNVVLTVDKLLKIWDNLYAKQNNADAQREAEYLRTFFTGSKIDEKITTNKGPLYAGELSDGTLRFYIVDEEAAPVGASASNKYRVGDYIFQPKNKALHEGNYWYNWKIISIKDDKVKIAKVYTGKKPSRAKTSYKTIEKGLNYIDGREVVLKETVAKRQAYFTIIPGTGKPLRSISNFTLHIPIEKRAKFLQLSKDKIGRKINETQKIIDDLDKVINKMDNILKTWKVV